MKENYQIYLPYQFRLRDQSAGRDPQLSHKKMKTLFLSNMSKSRRLTSTFFPDKRNRLADMLVNFFLLDKVTLEEHGTTKKLSITFLLRSGQLICFDPSSNSRILVNTEQDNKCRDEVVSTVSNF